MLHGIADHIVKGNDSQAVRAGLRRQGRRRHADDDPRDRLHDVPDDLRDHHAGADRRSVRRSHEVLRDVRVHGAVVADRLLADRALGLVALRLGCAGRHPGLRRRHRRAYQRRHRRPDLRAGARQAQRLSRHQHGAVQPGLRGDRRVAAVGRLVRLQRRLRGGAPTGAPAWPWR